MSDEIKTLEHEQFLQQYVLNRALANTHSLSGDGSAEAGERAWLKIKQYVDKEVSPSKEEEL